MQRRRAGRAAGGARIPPSGVAAAGSAPLAAKTAEPADADCPTAPGMAAAACDDDDGLEGLDLGRNWFTQAFRDSDVNLQHRRRQLRLIAPFTWLIILGLGVHDISETDLGAIDTDDTLLVVFAVFRFIGPLLVGCTLFAIWRAGG